MHGDKQTVWETYVAAWNNVSAQDKASALRRCAAPECTYQDPLASTRGHDALIDYMSAFHEQVPGARFVTTRFLAHHDASVATWQLLDGGGVVIGDGVSHGRYRDDGALIEMTGFFEPPAR